MIAFLWRTLIFILSAALGLLVADLLLDDLSVAWWFGGVLAVLIFVLAQSVLSPFILNMTRKYASAFIGGVGLLSTFVALLLAHLLTDGLSISGVVTWILATLIVWLVTALGTLLLPLFLVKKGVENARD